MPVTLRDYQGELLAEQGTTDADLVVLATGGGKTVIFSEAIRAHVGASIAIAHRREIITQISVALGKAGVKHRIIATPSTVARIRRRHLKILGTSYVEQVAQVAVASVQTLTSAGVKNDSQAQRFLDTVSLAVFDEGHHYVSTGFWARAVHRLENARLLFVTATPERADGKGLGAHASGFVENMIEGPQVGELIKRGYLSPFRYFAPASDFNVEGLACTPSGDFNAKALRARVVESHLVGDVVDHYLKFAKGKKCIVFAPDVATAEEMAARFRGAGVAALAVSGETGGGERDKALDDFESGELSVLVNVDLFDEGFDVPAVEAVLLARATESLSKYLQMCGRALRLADGKEYAVIIDSVRNWERHGAPDWPRVWSLYDAEKGSGKKRDGDSLIPQRVCTACTQPYEAFYTNCPYCGAPFVPDGRAEVKQVDGDLVELDTDAWAALFYKHKQANLSPEEFALDQATRHVPPIGRRAGQKRHDVRLYRRSVLSELVAWWVGAQDGRDMREVHKRFFLRFGVDVVTAFTLNEKDTDELARRIAERFGEDVIL